MTEEAIEHITYADEWLDVIIQKAKYVMEELTKQTFHRYRELGKIVLESGYKKGTWRDKHRAKFLNELGISQSTFSQMVQLGEMTEDKFIAIGNKFRSFHTWEHRGIVQKQKERELLIEELRERAKTLTTPNQKYDVIVIDPPWPIEHNYNPKHWRGASPYPELSIEELKKLKIPHNGDCVLWLWVTNRFMHEAFHILEAWDFTPKTIVTWIKHAFGLGVWLRGQTEHCIMATKGKPIIDLHEQSTAIFAKRKQHSRKPNEFYELVESLCFGKKLDYYNREPREGWDTFGTKELWSNDN